MSKSRSYEDKNCRVKEGKLLRVGCPEVELIWFSKDPMPIQLVPPDEGDGGAAILSKVLIEEGEESNTNQDRGGVAPSPLGLLRPGDAVRTVWLPGRPHPVSAASLPFGAVLRATMEGASLNAPLVVTFGPPPPPPRRRPPPTDTHAATTNQARTQGAASSSESPGSNSSSGGGGGGGVAGLKEGAAAAAARLALPKTLVERAAENPEALEESLRVLDSGVEKLAGAGKALSGWFLGAAETMGGVAETIDRKVAAAHGIAQHAHERHGLKWPLSPSPSSTSPSDKDSAAAAKRRLSEVLQRQTQTQTQTRRKQQQQQLRQPRAGSKVQRALEMKARREARKAVEAGVEARSHGNSNRNFNKNRGGGDDDDDDDDNYDNDDESESDEGSQGSGGGQGSREQPTAARTEKMLRLKVLSRLLAKWINNQLAPSSPSPPPSSSSSSLTEPSSSSTSVLPLPHVRCLESDLRSGEVLYRLCERLGKCSLEPFGRLVAPPRGDQQSLSSSKRGSTLSSLSNFHASFRFLRKRFRLPDDDDELGSEVINLVVEGDAEATTKLCWLVAVLFTAEKLELKIETRTTSTTTISSSNTKHEDSANSVVSDVSKDGTALGSQAAGKQTGEEHTDNNADGGGDNTDNANDGDGQEKDLKVGKDGDSEKEEDNSNDEEEEEEEEEGCDDEEFESVAVALKITLLAIHTHLVSWSKTCLTPFRRRLLDFNKQGGSSSSSRSSKLRLKLTRRCFGDGRFMLALVSSAAPLKCPYAPAAVGDSGGGTARRTGRTGGGGVNRSGNENDVVTAPAAAEMMMTGYLERQGNHKEGAKGDEEDGDEEDDGDEEEDAASGVKACGLNFCAAMGAAESLFGCPPLFNAAVPGEAHRVLEYCAPEALTLLVAEFKLCFPPPTQTPLSRTEGGSINSGCDESEEESDIDSDSDDDDDEDKDGDDIEAGEGDDNDDDGENRGEVFKRRGGRSSNSRKIGSSGGHQTTSAAESAASSAEAEAEAAAARARGEVHVCVTVLRAEGLPMPVNPVAAVRVGSAKARWQATPAARQLNNPCPIWRHSFVVPVDTSQLPTSSGSSSPLLPSLPSSSSSSVVRLPLWVKLYCVDPSGDNDSRPFATLALEFPLALTAATSPATSTTASTTASTASLSLVGKGAGGGSSSYQSLMPPLQALTQNTFYALDEPRHSGAANRNKKSNASGEMEGEEEGAVLSDEEDLGDEKGQRLQEQRRHGMRVQLSVVAMEIEAVAKHWERREKEQEGDGGEEDGRLTTAEVPTAEAKASAAEAAAEAGAAKLERLEAENAKLRKAAARVGSLAQENAKLRSQVLDLSSSADTSKTGLDISSSSSSSPSPSSSSSQVCSPSSITPSSSSPLSLSTSSPAPPEATTPSSLQELSLAWTRETDLLSPPLSLGGGDGSGGGGNCSGDV